MRVLAVATGLALVAATHGCTGAMTGAAGSVPDAGGESAAGDARAAEPSGDGAAELPPPAGDSGFTGLLGGPTTAGEVWPNRIPILWIELGPPNADADPDKVITSQDVKVPGTIKVFEEHDGSVTPADLTARKPTLDTTALGIDLRGSSTAYAVKKPWGIELRDADGKGLDVPLLGMPAGGDWALFPSYYDRTFLRSALVYAIGQELGRWNPRARFVELFINKGYRGLYMLIEKIRRGKARAGLPKPAATAADGDMTGGYIFAREGGGGWQGHETYAWDSALAVPLPRTTEPPGSPGNPGTPLPTVWFYKSPAHDEITPAQKKYLKSHVDGFEAAMNGPDWAHPDRGYRKWIDTPSWVDYSLVQEFSNNWDGYTRSAYFEKQSDVNGGLIYAGPLWDYDGTFGNVSKEASWAGGHGMGNGLGMRWDIWSYEKPFREANDNVLWLIPKLWAQKAFQDDIKCRWNELRTRQLDRAAIDTRLDAWLKYLAAAQKRDERRWPPRRQDLSRDLAPDAPIPSYAEEVTFFRGWIASRLKWLDQHLPGVCAATIN